MRVRREARYGPVTPERGIARDDDVERGGRRAPAPPS